MAVRVNMPQRQNISRGIQAPQIQARGRQLQAAAPAPPKQDWSAVGKSMMGLADQLQKSRQAGNRKTLIDNLVGDDAEVMTSGTGVEPEQRMNFIEGMSPQERATSYEADAFNASGPKPKRVNKMEAEGIPKRAQNAIRNFREAGDYDSAFKIYKTFATAKAPTPDPFTLGKDDRRFSPDGKLIAQGVSGEPKDSRPNIAKEYEYFVSQGYKGTIEEFAELRRKGTTVNVGNQSKIGKIPSEMVLREVPKTADNPEGLEIVPLQGSSLQAERKQQAKKAKGTQEAKERVFFTVNRDISGALDFIEETKNDLIKPTELGSYLSVFPATDAKRLKTLLKGVRSQISITSLQNMRDNSPTGGALGNVTERELKMLEESYGALDQSGPPDLLIRGLEDLQRIFHEIVHGPEAGREMYNATKAARMQRYGSANNSGGDSTDALVNKYLNPDS
jgi:hypothetical protein